MNGEIYFHHLMKTSKSKTPNPHDPEFPKRVKGHLISEEG